jgi:hypothetical protein
MGLDLNLDVDGLNIRRVRRAPAIINENKRVYYSEFELDIEPGLADPVPTTAAFSMVELVPTTVQGTIYLDVEAAGHELGGAAVLVTIDGTPAGSTLSGTNPRGFYSFSPVPAGAGVVDAAKAGLTPGTNSGTIAANAVTVINVVVTTPF